MPRLGSEGTRPKDHEELSWRTSKLSNRTFSSARFLQAFGRPWPSHGSCGISAESDTSDRNVKETELDCTYAQPSQHHRQAVRMARENETREIDEQRVVFLPAVLKLGKMCVRRRLSQWNLPSLMSAPAEKRFREVSAEDPMATQQGPVVRPHHQQHWNFEPYVDASVAAQFLPLARRRAA